MQYMGIMAARVIEGYITILCGIAVSARYGQVSNSLPNAILRRQDDLFPNLYHQLDTFFPQRAITVLLFI